MLNYFMINMILILIASTVFIYVQSRMYILDLMPTKWLVSFVGLILLSWSQFSRCCIYFTIMCLCAVYLRCVWHSNRNMTYSVLNIMYIAILIPAHFVIFIAVFACKSLFYPFDQCEIKIGNLQNCISQEKSNVTPYTGKKSNSNRNIN